MKTPTEISKVTIGQAIEVLRKKLGFSVQLPFARELNCEPGALARWERGESFPSGDWMLKLLWLCPNQETYDNFFLDITESGSKIRSTPGQEAPTQRKESPRPGSKRADGRVILKYVKPAPKAGT